MNLLPFQQSAVQALLDFFTSTIDLAGSTASLNKKKKASPAALAWLTSVDSDINYSDLITSNGTSIPNAAICIPTGGGKTIVGISSAIETLRQCVA